MMRKKVLTIVLILLVFVVANQGCNCEEEAQNKSPMTIRIIYPSGSQIGLGEFQYRIQDVDGIASIKAYLGSEEIDSVDGKGKEDITHKSEFNFKVQEKTFKLKVVATDTHGDSEEKEVVVTKIAGGPVLIFLEPTKIDKSHSAVIVGKKVLVKVQARDATGTSEIVLSHGASLDAPGTVIRRCSGSRKPQTKDICETTVDLSAQEYKSGKFYFFAEGKDVDANKSQRVSKVVLIDKEGPEIEFLVPKPGGSLSAQNEIKVKVSDQVGIKGVQFVIDGVEISGVKESTSEKDVYIATVDPRKFKNGGKVFKVIAYDNLLNSSDKELGAAGPVGGDCKKDEDCSSGSRCCVAEGKCYPTISVEGEECDPCTKPCGKGTDGVTMGCIPGPCGRKPYRCRRSCNRGSANQASDPCKAATSSSPAEYCTKSDISKINPQLGACAQGDFCDPLNPKVCPAGSKRPYKDCCPQGTMCFPADQDANICMVVGKMKAGQSGCKDVDDLETCSGDNFCGPGLICAGFSAPYDCKSMCSCSGPASMGVCQTSDCQSGEVCAVAHAKGKVPLKYGACVRFSLP